ncbi:uncharacterized protein LOC132624092 [Lycium barbarum]|uniref:uncharacterized protein LOC132624092 n=1 Tax=Lycium barbarum TaxID=112863 RepID=UPI00293E502E|nr:uncharacterized protein LOC132624092 [Lycium barbarum]
MEEIVKIKEELFEEVPIATNRYVLQCAHAEYKRYLHFEEEYWRQKEGVDWFVEGDINTRLFHNLMRGRRRKLTVRWIQGLDGSWIEDEAQMASQAVQFYQAEFSHEEANVALCCIPSCEEVKQAIFNLSRTSASGPDGFPGKFYQSCWDVVGRDIFRLVEAFFNCHSLLKSITHTNLVLLPKKDTVQAFSNLRPISLSNFVDKVISRAVHDRFEKVLPSLISRNQTGFAKGMSIIENVLLAQEIVTDIRKSGKPANVVIKLGMAKAYDRVCWSFLVKVLERLGFASQFLDQIWRLLANHWYSVLFNGQSTGFFHSTRGVKQGDPLSPALFILSIEVLSRSLNALFDDSCYMGYRLPKWSFNINHLSYANDTIYLHFSREDFSSENHEGCPIFHSRRKKVFYNDHIKKEKNKLQNWKGKLLSHGGKSVLISNVLPSIPWKFRTENTMWTTFMWNKYCKKFRPTEVQWRGGSQEWKKMLDASQEETVQHLFLTGDFAKSLWRKRNDIMHGKSMSTDKVLYRINYNLHNLVRDVYPWLKEVPHDWPQLIKFLEGVRSTSSIRLVHWNYPRVGWFKCNTDGASRGNPGLSSVAFCIRDDRGDLVYASARQLQVTTNIVAEATVMRDAVIYYISHQLFPVIIESD